MLQFTNAGTGLNVVAVMDPLSNDAQKLIPVLMVSVTFRTDRMCGYGRILIIVSLGNKTA